MHTTNILVIPTTWFYLTDNWTSSPSKGFPKFPSTPADQARKTHAPYHWLTSCSSVQVAPSTFSHCLTNCFHEPLHPLRKKWNIRNFIYKSRVRTPNVMHTNAVYPKKHLRCWRPLLRELNETLCNRYVLGMLCTRVTVVDPGPPHVMNCFSLHFKKSCCLGPRPPRLQHLFFFHKFFFYLPDKKLIPCTKMQCRAEHAPKDDQIHHCRKKHHKVTHILQDDRSLLQFEQLHNPKSTIQWFKNHGMHTLPNGLPS